MMMKELKFDDQWIGYDDDETIKAKKDWADNWCFGGTMAWSVDFNSGVGNGLEQKNTTDGTCGKANGNTVCGSWPQGNCCSRYVRTSLRCRCRARSTYSLTAADGAAIVTGIAVVDASQETANRVVTHLMEPAVLSIETPHAKVGQRENAVVREGGVETHRLIVVQDASQVLVVGRISQSKSQ